MGEMRQVGEGAKEGLGGGAALDQASWGLCLFYDHD